MNSKAGSWIGATVLAAALASVAVWFLVLSPRMESIDSIKSETQAVNDQNDILEIKIAKLKVDFAKLDEYKAEMAAIQIQIPTVAGLADYTTQVAAIAEANAVAVTTWAPGAPFSFMPAVPTAATTTDPAAEVAAVAAGQLPGFVAMPFNLTVVGTYANTQAFLNQLQTGTQRLFLVTALTGDSQLDAEAAGGRPATAVGDIQLAITGYTYVLQDPAFSAGAPTEPTEPTPLPVSVPGANPLVPVAGQ